LHVPLRPDLDQLHGEPEKLNEQRRIAGKTDVALVRATGGRAAARCGNMRPPLASEATRRADKTMTEPLPGRDAASTVDSLILDLLEWIGPDSRPYPQVIEAWRTSCPRLPVWEEASERGFLEHRQEPGRGACVAVSARGREYMWTRGPGTA
jgi:hypothetical protein